MKRNDFNTNELRHQMVLEIQGKLEEFKMVPPKDPILSKNIVKMVRKGGKKAAIFENKYISLGLPLVDFRGCPKTEQLKNQLYLEYALIIRHLEDLWGNFNWLCQSSRTLNLADLDLKRRLDNFDSAKRVKKRFKRKPTGFDRTKMIGAMNGIDIVKRVEYNKDKRNTKVVFTRKMPLRNKSPKMVRGKEVIYYKWDSSKPYMNPIEHAKSLSEKDSNFSLKDPDPWGYYPIKDMSYTKRFKDLPQLQWQVFLQKGRNEKEKKSTL